MPTETNCKGYDYTDCLHYGICFLRRHREARNIEPCKDFELDTMFKDWHEVYK
jgi:hypothetical protein